MSYEVEWSRPATKELLSIEKKQRLMILKWVEENLAGCENPKSIPGSKALRGTGTGWRYRVGSYRILATIDEGKLVIGVFCGGKRRGVHKNLPRGVGWVVVLVCLGATRDLRELFVRLEG